MKSEKSVGDLKTALENIKRRRTLRPLCQWCHVGALIAHLQGRSLGSHTGIWECEEGGRRRSFLLFSCILSVALDLPHTQGGAWRQSRSHSRAHSTWRWRAYPPDCSYTPHTQNSLDAIACSTPAPAPHCQLAAYIWCSWAYSCRGDSVV